MKDTDSSGEITTLVPMGLNDSNGKKTNNIMKHSHHKAIKKAKFKETEKPSWIIEP